MLLMVPYMLVPVGAAYCSGTYSAAAYEFGYADLLRTQPRRSFASRLKALWATCGRPGRLAGRKRRPLARHGRLAVCLLADTLAWYVSNEGDVKVR